MNNKYIRHDHTDINRVRSGTELDRWCNFGAIFLGELSVHDKEYLPTLERLNALTSRRIRLMQE